jgi:hypothetical protein
MRISSALALTVAVLQVQSAAGSQIASRPLTSVAEGSGLIVVGVVEGIERVSSSNTYGEVLLATVRVVSTLKGAAPEPSFKLRLRVGGIRGFDVPLSEGDQAVFFLRSIESGEANLSTWGSVALLKSGYFH